MLLTWCQFIQPQGLASSSLIALGSHTWRSNTHRHSASTRSALDCHTVIRTRVKTVAPRAHRASKAKPAIEHALQEATASSKANE